MKRLFLLTFLFFCHLQAQPLSNEQIGVALKAAARQAYISVDSAGYSVNNNPLFLAHLYHGSRDKQPWKVFLYGQQHGNEHAGKDALMALIKKIAADPDYLPEDVELWIIPSLNPDGNAADRRRNANDADLNRDHVVMQQPETRILHEAFRRIMPHVAVDCHEFGRDSRDYAEQGWSEWPIIMMDCANNPLYSKELFMAGQRWCEKIEPFMAAKGINYTRYYVGGVPPLQEQRFSTLEADDGRNGLGAYGGLSFIIESGVKRNMPDPQADLEKRVQAYLAIFDRLLHDDTHRAEERRLIEQARAAQPPSFIPVNYFWANTGPTVYNVKVIDTTSAAVKEIATPNFMKTRVIKRSVPTPQGYLIDASAAVVFKPWLERQGLQFEEWTQERGIRVQAALFERLETEYDDIYNRYDGRQIVTLQKDSLITFGKGSLYVPVEQPLALRVPLLLEPSMLYGIYEWQPFRELAVPGRPLPVYRVIKN